MTQADDIAAAYSRKWRQPRYRYRLLLGLAMLVGAAGATGWIVWAVVKGRLPASAAGGQELAGLSECLRLGYRSFIVVALCAGAMLCAMRPLRLARPDYARLAAAEVMIGGLLASAVMLVYWLFWSPMSFMK